MVPLQISQFLFTVALVSLIGGRHLEVMSVIMDETDMSKTT